MKTRTIEHKNLNGGKPFDFKYVITEDELDNQVYEILDSEEYAFEKKKDGVYIDLGANSGMASLYFSQFAKKIYAIEPSPKVYETLVENTKHLKNVETFNLAWGVADREDFLFTDESKYEPQSFFSRVEFPRGVKVNTVKPSTFFKENNIEHVDVMKVDIEESEYLIFPDDDFGLIAPKIDVIIGESHIQKDGGFPEIVPALLERWGYKTIYPKLSHPNYFQTFTYNNLMTGQRLEAKYPRETIFVAVKK